MALPLSDLRVLQIGGLVEIPYAGRLLADLGAAVLCVEPPGGSRLRSIGPFNGEYNTPRQASLHLHLNRGKQAVTLDVDVPSGRDLLRRLVQDHDVVLHDFDRETANDLGLGDEARHSNVISVAITPFGQIGPKAAWRGYELNVQAMSGVVLGLGAPGRPPLPIPDFVTEFFVGSVASLAVMLGVTARDRWGAGQTIDLSSSDAWATFQTGLALVNWLFGAQQVQRGGQARRGGPYPNTILKCKDGDYRLIAMTKREWVRFLEVMGNPEWGKDERFQDRIKMNALYADELDTLISEWLLPRTKREIFEVCYEGGVPFTPVNTFKDVLNDPQLAARQAWLGLNVDGLSNVRVPRSPHGLPSTDTETGERAPDLGEHNYGVYVGRLGAVSPGEFQQLYQSGAI